MDSDDKATRDRAVQLVTRRRAQLEGYALAVTGDHQLAEDAVQEVAALVAAEPRRVPPGEQAGAWLREVTRRKALERGRGARRGGLLLSLDVLETLEGAFGAAEVVEAEAFDGRRAALARCVERVPAGQRALLDARYGENLTAEELAQRVGRSVQGVYAALKRLRSALGRCMRAQLENAGREGRGSRHGEPSQ